MSLIEILNSIPAGFYTLLGVALGFCLNLIKDWYDNRNILCCGLRATTVEDDWNIFKSLKVGPSGFIMEIYNCARNPLLIESMRLIRKSKFIDVVIPEIATVMPYQKYEYQLTRQEYETLIEWATEDMTRRLVKVKIRTVMRNSVSCNLDITLIMMHTGIPFRYPVRIRVLIWFQNNYERVLSKIKNMIKR